MLKGKTVLLGVTGGIACYKSAGLASALVKQGGERPGTHDPKRHGVYRPPHL